MLPEDIKSFVTQTRLLNAPQEYKDKVAELLGESLTTKQVVDRLTDCVIKLLEGQKLESIQITTEDMEKQSKTEVEVKLDEKGFNFTIKKARHSLHLI